MLLADGVTTLRLPLLPSISQSSSSIPSPLSSFSSYLRTLLTLSPLSARPTPYVHAGEGRKFVPFAFPLLCPATSASCSPRDFTTEPPAVEWLPSTGTL